MYLAEAHAIDEWPMNPDVIAQPKTASERAAAATTFVEEHEFRWPVVCDTMDDQFLTTFGAWPTRFFAVYEGKLAFKIQPNRDGRFDVAELADWIVEFVEARHSI